jgi:hypothetical protein
LARAADDLYGGRGWDDLIGGFGPDYIVGGQGQDELYSNSGNDRIEAAEGQRDLIDCGPGNFDRASVDEQDIIDRCEIVKGEPVE